MEKKCHSVPVSCTPRHNEPVSPFTAQPIAAVTSGGGFAGKDPVGGGWCTCMTGAWLPDSRWALLPPGRDPDPLLPVDALRLCPLLPLLLVRLAPFL